MENLKKRVTESKYKCDKCQDIGFIFIDGAAKQCDCQIKKHNVKRIKQSGLQENIRNYTFDNFQAEEEFQKNMLYKAKAFIEQKEFPFFYIGGQVGCVDADTEYFTGKEWKRIAEYEGGKVLQYNPKTKEATLIEPNKYIKKPANTLYQITTKRGSINQCLSANHDFAYITSKGHMQKKEFAKIMEKHQKNTQGFYGRVETAFNFNGKGIGLTENEIRLMCAVIADGSFKKSLQLCTINIKKQRKIDRLRKLLIKTDREHKEYIKSNGFHEFRFYAPRREKIFSSYWYKCNNNQLRTIVDEIFNWDGTVDQKGRKKYFTNEKQSADFIQFAISATGNRSTINYDTHKERVNYVVNLVKNCSLVSMASTGGRNKAEIKIVKPKDGYQYCFQVNTGYLVLRRKDRIFITGNSGKTHICTSICINYLNEKYSVAYKSYSNVIQKLKANANDGNYYDMILARMQNVDVLYLDDLFKTGKGEEPTAADIRHIFNLINYRYIKDKITIFSSERSINDLLDIDEGLGSRIKQKAGEYCITIKQGKGRNWRLK